MLCNLTKVHLIRYSFFALVLSCCLSLFGFVSDSHATDIVSEHYVSNSGPVAFCGSLVTLHASSDRNCSDYSFLFILPSKENASIYFYWDSYGGNLSTSNVVGQYIAFDVSSVSHAVAYKVSFDYDWWLVPKSSEDLGSLSITQNGTFDVKDYSSVDVNVECESCSDTPSDTGGGLSPDDLDRLIKAILTIPAVLLLLYFFYCIYRIFIRIGGKP